MGINACQASKHTIDANIRYLHAQTIIAGDGERDNYGIADSRGK